MMIDMDIDNTDRVRDVIVVTDSNAQSGGKAAADRCWTVSKGIAARYEYRTGEFIEKAATVIWREQGSRDDWNIELKPESVYYLKVYDLDRNEYDYPDMVKDILCLHSVTEYDDTTMYTDSLDQFFKGYIQMDIIDDDETGSFVYNRSEGYYVKQGYEWLGSEIEIRLESENGNREEGIVALGYFKELNNSMEEYDRLIRGYAADKATDAVNELNYNIYAEYAKYEPVSREAFMRRIKVKMISISQKGIYRFSLDDDDMLWGHQIIVEGNMTDGPSALL